MEGNPEVHSVSIEILVGVVVISSGDHCFAISAETIVFSSDTSVDGRVFFVSDVDLDEDGDTLSTLFIWTGVLVWGYFFDGTTDAHNSFQVVHWSAE